MCGSEQDQSRAKGGGKRAMWRSGRVCGVGDFPDFFEFGVRCCERFILAVIGREGGLGVVNGLFSL